MFARICKVILSLLFIQLLGAHAYAADPATAKQPPEANKIELRISNDGKALVDQNGKDVARFVKGTEVKQKGGVMKMQGCLCCQNDCVIYDHNGVCIKTVRSCVYDFDCSCRR